jgi:hypothetical protein
MKPTEGPEIPAAVQVAIDAYAKYYAEHHKLGLSIRDNMRYIAQVAMRWAPGVPQDKIAAVERAFDYLGNNQHEPWVKVSFPIGDWAARDAFANALGGEKKSAPTTSSAEPKA